MGTPRAVATAVLLLLLQGATLSVAHAAERQIEFRWDDPEGQRIGRRLLAKDLADQAKYSSEAPRFQTAWVRLSASPARTLLVFHSCGAANCSLDAFERSNGRWRQVLFSTAQTVAVLPTSHEGRRDLVASMHGSATMSAIKTYWWQKNRYVRVSVRDVTYPHDPD